MNWEEVVLFSNHKYGECAFALTTYNTLLLFTLRSKWIIHLDDFSRFKKYSLYHWNELEGLNYHKQCDGGDVGYLVYYAIRHDLDLPANFKNFCHLYEMWRLGREIEERAATFNFLSSNT